MNETDSTDSGGGLGGLLKGMGRTFVSLLSNRAELFLLEFQEEREHWIQALFLGMIAMIFGILTLVVLSLGLVVWLWDSHPVLALIGLACLYGGVSLTACLQLRRYLKAHQSFTGSMNELKKDREWLNREK